MSECEGTMQKKFRMQLEFPLPPVGCKICLAFHKDSGFLKCFHLKGEISVLEIFSINKR